MSAKDPDTGELYSQDRLLSEVQNLMLAAHETTANLMTWTLSSIARNPGQQNELRNEIRNAMGTDAPTVDNQRKTRGMLQAWRHQVEQHPPNFLIAREAIADTFIGSDDDRTFIEAGTTIMVSTEHANRDSGNGVLSFGSGKRFCPGIGLARFETEVGLNRFLQRFEVTDTGERGMTSGLTQLPEDTTVTVRKAAI